MTPHDLLLLGDNLDIFADPTSIAPGAPLPDNLINQGLTPPIPVTTEPDALLVWGWPIVRVAMELGIQELATRTLDLGPLDALTLALQLEKRTGHYTWAEQESVVSYLEASEPGGADPGIRDWAAVSQLVRGDGALADLVFRYRKLNPALRAVVDDEFVSLKTAERIGRVPGEFLLEHRGALGHLSFSARRQFLELFAELLARPANPGAGNDATAGISALAGAALSENDAVSALRRLRYPTLTDLEDQFGEIRRGIFHGTGVELTAPPYFEGESFTVAFTFRNCAELEERTRSLERLKGSCEELFGIL